MSAYTLTEAEAADTLSRLHPFDRGDAQQKAKALVATENNVLRFIVNETPSFQAEALAEMLAQISGEEADLDVSDMTWGEVLVTFKAHQWEEPMSQRFLAQVTPYQVWRCLHAAEEAAFEAVRVGLMSYVKGVTPSRSAEEAASEAFATECAKLAKLC